MEIRQLKYFLAVLKAGNFTRAAGRLGITQPTLSQQIRQLELSLGSPLFNRLGRSVSLTAAGELLVEPARRSVQAVTDAQDAIASVNGVAAGQLRLAYLPSLRPLMASAIMNFMTAFPGVKVQLHEETGKYIMQRLSALEVDFGVSALRVTPPELTTEVLYQEALVLVFRRGHPLEKTGIKSLKCIGQTPFALYSYGTTMRDVVDDYLGQVDFEPNTVLEADSTACIFDLMEDTDICALLPNSAVSREKLNCIELPGQQPNRSVALFSNRKANRSLAAVEFAKLLQAAAVKQN